LDTKGVREVETSSVLEEPGIDWDGQNLIDGETSTVWVPDDGEDDPTVVLRLKPPRDLQLFCVVNGAAANWVSCLRADRVRTATAWTEPIGQAEPPTSTLLNATSEFDVGNPQALEITPGMTDKVGITIKDTYSGRMSTSLG
jgi:hypothetical protein